MINQGKVSEQFIGQHLLYQNDYYKEPQLYFWNREQRNSSAEVDYIITHGQHVIPVEIKSGKTGSLKSLHLFLSTKKTNWAVRFNCDLPSLTTVSNIYSPGSFKLISIPMYLVDQLPRLLKENI